MQMMKNYQHLPQSLPLRFPHNSRTLTFLVTFLLIFGVVITFDLIFSTPLKHLQSMQFSIQSAFLSPPPHCVSPPSPHQLRPQTFNAIPTSITERNLIIEKEIDEEEVELLERASMAPKVAVRPLKVAFLFLVRGEIPFMPLWEKFFKGHEGMYSIYVHSDPLYNGIEPENSVFYQRRIPSRPVEWGKVNMMEAERRLIANALLDYSNQRFILLSESCVPLFNLPTIYSHLINSTQTFVEVIEEVGPRRRYRNSMEPVIMVYDWRKGSQWFEIDREIAMEVVTDQIYFRIFKSRCQNKFCYMDEHYLPTLVHIKFGWKNANRSVTWADWSQGGNHPVRYSRPQVTPEFLRELRGGSNCTYNGKVTNMCYLFARKFYPNALSRFLYFGPKELGIR